MKSFISYAASALLLSLVASSTASFAAPGETTKSCMRLARDCYSKESIERANCFFSVAKSTECTDSALGQLLYRRWTLSTDTTISGQTPPALLGPSSYDQDCVAQCDQKLLAPLAAENISARTCAGIETCYDSCEQKLDLEVFHP
jgi:hypothetical protein